MLDYVAVTKVWIFASVAFAVGVAIIFIVRSILNRRRSHGPVSTRPVSGKMGRHIRERPLGTVGRILPFLSVSYVIYALLIAGFICRVLFRAYRAQSAGQLQLSGIQWMPLGVTAFLAFALIGICVWLALCLSAWRWRRGALVLACISCISIPIGTILGGLTIYALTRPEVGSEFT